ncbi:hypothetical protein ACT91Q_16550 [Brevibacillus thermoruber]|uniref:hypothetical protein n=1 Tax=Brevibacillus thermoruber TaxID=33942 RepID=UPI004042DED8
MVEHVLELRGIPLSHLVAYLVECGGDPPPDETLPIVVQGHGWQAEVLREESVRITSRFHVNAVFIRFHADDDHTLNRLLDRFRIKVMRVGG